MVKMIMLNNTTNNKNIPQHVVGCE